jgi:hypothetical protein
LKALPQQPLGFHLRTALGIFDHAQQAIGHRRLAPRQSIDASTTPRIRAFDCVPVSVAKERAGIGYRRRDGIHARNLADRR